MEKPISVLLIVNYESNDKSIGVTKKIDGLLSAMRNKGFSVYYTSYSETSIDVVDDRDNVVFSYPYFFNGKAKDISRRFDLINAAEKYIKQSSYRFDIVFTRWIGFDLPFISLLKTIKKKMGSYIIIDMHSYFEGIHFPSLKGKYMTINTDLFKGTAVKYLDTILTEGSIENMFGKKTVPARIGVDVDSLQKHCYKGNADELHIISVANERPYHGYDRLIKSLAEYNNTTKKVYLHLVGVVYESTRKLVEELKLDNHVFLYGKQSGEKLDEIYDKCNIGAGPICQFRVGGKKDSGLKTKEYFGRGIPYFFSGEENLIPEDYPYTFKIKDDDSLIDFNEIIRFYNSYASNNEVGDHMRAFARKYYSWDAIVNDFLEDYYRTRKGIV